MQTHIVRGRGARISINLPEGQMGQVTVLGTKSTKTIKVEGKSLIKFAA